MEEMGYCQGIENYSRHLTGRKPGEPPPTLMEYLPEDALIIIDESHATIPQLIGMYRGDRSRKETLVNTASACLRPSTTGRSRSRSTKPFRTSGSMSRRRPAEYETEERHGDGWWSRSSGPRA